VTNPLQAFANEHQQRIAELANRDVFIRHYVNAALNLAYPGSKRQPLDRPIPERTMQVAILAAHLAKFGFDDEKLVAMMDDQDERYREAVKANNKAGQTEHNYQISGAKKARAEATKELLAKLDFGSIKL
jgi:hypothetical protein